MAKRETAPRFAGIGGHHSASPGTVEWLTPPAVIEALGPFDLDPCTPIDQPYPTARERYTIVDDGLTKDWDPKKRVWLCPPYTDGVIELWMAKLVEHGRGTALIFARTETAMFFRCGWEAATAVLFMRGRINFHVGEAFSQLRWIGGRPTPGRTYLAGERAAGNAGAPTVLLAYGDDDAERLAESGIDGQFVPLVFSRSVLVSALGDVTWRELVVGAIQDHEGEIVSVEAIWLVVSAHKKAQGRKHVREKVRQVLQAVGERVARGQYRLAV